MIRTLDATFSVAPQISPEALADVAKAGFGRVINNRPEGEESNQPSNAAMQAAAEAAGLSYIAIPTVMGGMTMAQVQAMADALGSTDQPVLAFCRSGTRSCNLWALAMASRGADADTLIEKAQHAGYDLGGIHHILTQLAKQG